MAHVLCNKDSFKVVLSTLLVLCTAAMCHAGNAEKIICIYIMSFYQNVTEKEKKERKKKKERKTEKKWPTHAPVCNV